MLAFVPAVISLYRPLKPHLRWTMQCLVSFADRGGRCFPSVRKVAEHAGISKSAAARHLSELSRIGVISRERRPGRGYQYRIHARFLPRAPVSHPQLEAVPPDAGQETELAKQTREGARTRARFAHRKVSFGAPPDSFDKWTPRVRAWRKSGFWLAEWGARPNEAGCFAPAALLTSSG
jgi:DNA-binding transcriptional ArsR family regulator